VFIFYVLEFTAVHTLDDTDGEITTPEVEGDVDIGPRIVGGFPATMGQFPYQVLIYSSKNSDKYMCGGAIISERHILTAAHCVSGVSNIEVLAGNIDRNPKKIWIHASVSDVSVHEEYLQEDSKGPYNDIAVITLQEALHLDGRATGSLNLRDTESPSGELCKVSGWGATKEDGFDSSILRYVQVSIVDRETCSGQLGKELGLGEICAGSSSVEKDSCSGDSGGPLVCGGYLTGVVSWGDGCGRKNKPGVYANVFFYKEWIEKRTSTAPPVNSNPNERSKKNTATDFRSGLFVLSFMTLLIYIIQ